MINVSKELINGKILKATGGFYYVEVTTPNGSELIECKAKGIFRKDGISPCCGDEVKISVAEQGYAIIEEIYERRNYILRPPMANLDLLLIICSVKDPSINYQNLDKLLSIAYGKNINAGLIITKTDLSDNEEEEALKIYNNAKIPAIAFSLQDTSTKEQILQLIKNKTVAFVGNSGVGKSTLLNYLFPDFNLKTAQISKKLGRGKHTTRTVEFYKTGSGYIADTPGFSTIELSRYELKSSDELKYTFLEFEKYNDCCKFTSCSHICEKGCLVLDAVKNGEISESRHKSYVAMFNELKDIKSWEKK